MKNFIFISPNFPTNYWKFCAELKKNGMNVLGIGDCPYDDLMPELRGSLSEYFKVSSLENYEEVFRAVAFLTYRHGKIDARSCCSFPPRCAPPSTSPRASRKATCRASSTNP